MYMYMHSLMCLLAAGDCGLIREEPFPHPIPKLHDDLNAQGQVWDVLHGTIAVDPAINRNNLA